MAASVYNGQYSTFIGTPKQIAEAMREMGANVGLVNMQYSRIVLVEEPISDVRLAQVLALFSKRAEA